MVYHHNDLLYQPDVQMSATLNCIVQERMSQYFNDIFVKDLIYKYIPLVRSRKLHIV